MTSKFDIKSFNQFEPYDIDYDHDNIVKILHNIGESLASYIKTNAKEYLQESKMGKYYFYRGVYDTSPEVAFIKKTRLNRIPRDSHKNNQLLDNYFIDLVGGTANRSNSVFSTSSFEHASEYGNNVYVIIPLGDMWYTWSPYYKDWYSDDDDMDAAPLDMSHTGNILDLYKKTISEILTDKEYQQLIHKYDSYLPELVQNWLLLYIKKNIPMPPIMKKANKIIIPKLKNIILGDDGTLGEAYRVKNEIFFHCDEILAIDPHIYSEVVLPLLQNKKLPSEFSLNSINNFLEIL